MPEINKINRSKNIKQVSRTEDLKPATEKPITKIIPKIESKKTFSAETVETVIDQPVNTPFEAAKSATISAIRHTKTLSESSDKQADQEAIDKIEQFSDDTMADTVETALIAKDTVQKRVIRKKSIEPSKMSSITSKPTRNNLLIIKLKMPLIESGFFIAVLTSLMNIVR